MKTKRSSDTSTYDKQNKKTRDKPYFTTTRNNIYSCPPSLKEIHIIKKIKKKTAEPEIRKNVKKERKQ